MKDCQGIDLQVGDKIAWRSRWSGMKVSEIVECKLYPRKVYDWKTRTYSYTEIEGVVVKSPYGGYNICLQRSDRIVKVNA